MPQLKLYYSPGSCSLAAHVILREVGADFTLIKEETNKFSSEFLALNPKARIPVLVMTDDEGKQEHVITEAVAILTAIAQLPGGQGKHLLGKTPMDVVRTYEWMNWLSGIHSQGYGCLLRPHRFSDDPAAFEGIKAKGWKMAREGYAAVEDRLAASSAAGSKWAVGDSFTVVDAYLLAMYRWPEKFGIIESTEAAYPAYTALVREISKRETVDASIKAEGIAPTFSD